MNREISKLSIERQSQYLDFLVNPSFQGINRLFINVDNNEDNNVGRN